LSLAVGVVVFILRAGELVTGEQHRGFARKQERRQHVAHLADRRSRIAGSGGMFAAFIEKA
jgi:hypothetical protein